MYVCGCVRLCAGVRLCMGAVVCGCVMVCCLGGVFDVCVGGVGGWGLGVWE